MEPWYCETDEHEFFWVHWWGYDMQMCSHCAYGFLTNTTDPIPTYWWEEQKKWWPDCDKIAETMRRNPWAVGRAAVPLYEDF